MAADRQPKSHHGAGELGDLRSAPSGPEAGNLLGITHIHTQWPVSSECGCLRRLTDTLAGDTDTLCHQSQSMLSHRLSVWQVLRRAAARGAALATQ